MNFYATVPDLFFVCALASITTLGFDDLESSFMAGKDLRSRAVKP